MKYSKKKLHKRKNLRRKKTVRQRKTFRRKKMRGGQSSCRDLLCGTGEGSAQGDAMDTVCCEADAIQIVKTGRAVQTNYFPRWTADGRAPARLDEKMMRVLGGNLNEDPTPAARASFIGLTGKLWQSDTSKCGQPGFSCTQKADHHCRYCLQRFCDTHSPSKQIFMTLNASKEGGMNIGEYRVCASHPVFLAR